MNPKVNVHNSAKSYTLKNHAFSFSPVWSVLTPSPVPVQTDTDYSIMFSVASKCSYKSPQIFYGTKKDIK